MQQRRAVQVSDESLKEAISDVKREGYRRAIVGAHSVASLTRIEHEIRFDFQLTQDARLQLLGEVGIASVPLEAGR
jgi:hypothetical protein